MTRREESRRKWWVIGGIVLAFHLALLLFVRPEYFDFLLRDVDAPSGARGSSSSSLPDAIIAIQIDVEDADAELPAEPELSSVTPTPPTPEPRERDGEGQLDAMETIDVGDILGDAAEPRRGGGTRRQETIPPRPVEITWPETRRLKHCIGRHVDVRILVARDGRIREVVPQAADIAPDCLRAALDAARRIKFTPGRVNGEPAELWAQVRIDFEEKR
ncbi:MAG: energy transducer TonB [Candidatus Krumholzibacteria bacterium]|nr:energy transducer TonB [Candidatus Krumholzibacteria bacterium]MDH4338670.1 energy transducer TonB [Candidatus Krumholzibacteria bacterium]MDH5271355.1 energy transducer TonB [Candidatus Krumholzibacteria bacterium]